MSTSLALLFALQTSIMPPWVFDRQIDPIHDTPTIAASLTQPGGSLRLGCTRNDSGMQRFIVVTSPQFLGTGPGQVEARIDRGPVTAGVWDYHDNSAIALDGADALIAQMSHGSVFTVRLRRYDGSPVDLSFTLNIINAVVARLDRSCAEETRRG